MSASPSTPITPRPTRAGSVRLGQLGMVFARPQPGRITLLTRDNAAEVQFFSEPNTGRPQLTTSLPPRVVFNAATAALHASKFPNVKQSITITPILTSLSTDALENCRDQGNAAAARNFMHSIASGKDDQALILSAQLSVTEENNFGWSFQRDDGTTVTAKRFTDFSDDVNREVTRAVWGLYPYAVPNRTIWSLGMAMVACVATAGLASIEGRTDYMADNYPVFFAVYSLLMLPSLALFYTIKHKVNPWIEARVNPFSTVLNVAVKQIEDRISTATTPQTGPS